MRSTTTTINPTSASEWNNLYILAILLGAAIVVVVVFISYRFRVNFTRRDSHVRLPPRNRQIQGRSTGYPAFAKFPACRAYPGYRSYAAYNGYPTGAHQQISTMPNLAVRGYMDKQLY